MPTRPARRAKKTATRHRPSRPTGLLWSIHIAGPRGARIEESRTEQLFIEGTTGMSDVRSVYPVAERTFHVPEDRILAVPTRDRKGKLITRRPRG